MNESTCLRVDCSHKFWVITSRSRTAFPPAEVSLEREAALPVSSQSTPPSARVSNIDAFSWVIDEPVRDMLGRAGFVTHSRADGSRVRISPVADEEIVSWREHRFHTYEAFSRSKRNADARGQRSLPGESVFLHPAAADPEWAGNTATMTVRKVSLMLEYLRHRSSFPKVGGRDLGFLRLQLPGSSCHSYR